MSMNNIINACSETIRQPFSLQLTVLCIENKTNLTHKNINLNTYFFNFNKLST